jgi:hypothetical protein
MAAMLTLAATGLAGCSSGTNSATSPATHRSTAASAGSHTTAGGRASGPSKSPQSTLGTPSAPAPATEFRPPGDIPDNQVFVPYSVPGSHVQIKVPEGWARSTQGAASTFSDHFNSITIQAQATSTAPTISSAQRQDVSALKKAGPPISAVNISRITRTHGHAVLITYHQDSQPDPVTNKVAVEAVQRYEFFQNGEEAILTLSGPVNADNVDPWRIVSDSLTWK